MVMLTGGGEVIKYDVVRSMTWLSYDVMVTGGEVMLSLVVVRSEWW